MKNRIISLRLVCMREGGPPHVVCTRNRPFRHAIRIRSYTPTMASRRRVELVLDALNWDTDTCITHAGIDITYYPANPGPS